MRLNQLILPLMTAAMFVLHPLASAQETTSPTETIDPKAAEVLRDFTEHLKSARTLTVNTFTTNIMKRGSEQREMSFLYDVAVQRPDKIAIVQNSGPMGGTIVSNGTTVTIHNTALGTYESHPAPDNINEIDGMMEGPGASFGLYTFPPSFWGAQPYTVLMDGVTSGVYVGKVELNGVTSHHLRFAQN